MWERSLQKATVGLRGRKPLPWPSSRRLAQFRFSRMVALLVVFIAACRGVPAAQAAGLLTPEGSSQSLAIESQQVSVRIDNGIAVTTVNQVFRNPESRALEALYTFPVPREASVSNFSLWVAGQEVVGEVLERKKAREIYRQVTRVERKDPGLLEQVDFKTFEMRVFPVPARGTQRIQITYYQPLDYDSGFATYVYPLEMDEAARTGIERDFSVLVDVQSSIPLKRIESPSHRDALVAAELGPNRYRASVEANQGNLDRDFVLVYELERERTELEVVTSREPGQDGFFLMQLTPDQAFDEPKKQVNATFVIDASGSMTQAGKLAVARQAAGLAIAALGDGDTFNIIAFNIAPNALAEQPLPATAENRARAIEFLNGLEGRGGTDIASALARALEMQVPDARNAIVLLSDGQATATDDHSTFLVALRQRDREARVFSFGIGNEVNRPLLDRLAAETGGLADYVSGQDDVERKVRQMQAKLASPVAENLALKVAGVDVYDLVPARLPNLYRGQQLTVLGRYRGAGKATFSLTGKLLGKSDIISADVEMPEVAKDHPQIQRMWAWRQVDARLAQFRAGEQSPALVDEIIGLGTQYSIVTPFTAFLVLENEAAYQRFAIERVNARRTQVERAAIDTQFSVAGTSTPRPMATEIVNAAPATPAAQPANEPALPPETVNASQPAASDNDLGSSNSGGGGAVEWLFLLSAGLMGLGRYLTRR